MFAKLKDMVDNVRQSQDPLHLDKLLHMAKSKYTAFVSSGERTDTKSKGKASILNADDSSKDTDPQAPSGANVAGGK